MPPDDPRARPHAVRRRPRRARAGALALAACAVLGAVVSMRPADAASTNVVVSMNVASQTALGNSCTSPAATSLGVVLPGASATTSTGAGVCSVTWNSSNDTSKLRIAMSDATAPAMAQASLSWNNGRSSTASRLLGMAAFNASIVFAVGENGDVYRSSDGGTTWRQDYVTSGHWAFDVEFVPGDSNRWVIVAGDGEVYSTTNGVSSLPGAATWVNHAAALLAAGWAPTADIGGVAVISATTWMIGGDDGWVARTTNAGVSWTAYQLAVQADITDIDAVSATEYVASTTWGRLHRTTTSGVNAGAWTTHTPSDTQYISDLVVADATHVYAASRAGTIYRWDGAVFDDIAVQPSRFATQLQTVASPTSSPATVWVTGDFGVTWKSSDSGATWSRQKLATASTVGSAFAVNASTVYYGGSNNDLVKTTDGGATSAIVRSDPTEPPMLGIDADPVDGRRAIAVGGKGAIFRTTNKGGTWNSVASGTTEHLYDISMSSSSSGWIVGEAGTILRTIDGGATWSAQTSGVPTIALRAVSAASDFHAWAVGDDGTVLVTTNGGSTWVAQNSTTTQPLIDVAAASSTSAMIVASDGVMRVTSNGGAAWANPASPPTSWRWEGVVSLGSSTFVAIGRFGDVQRSTDGGNTWSLVTWTWGDIQGLDAAGNVLNALTSDGDVATSYDQGSTWDVNGGLGRGAMAMATVDINSNYVVKSTTSVWDTDETAIAARQVSDYGAGANFGSGSATSTFGVCLQAVGAGTAPAVGWSVDGGTCTATDTDPWKAVPTLVTDLATVGLGTTGRVDLVWGARTRGDQPAGPYSAGVSFEAVAPG